MEQSIQHPGRYKGRKKRQTPALLSEVLSVVGEADTSINSWLEAKGTTNYYCRGMSNVWWEHREENNYLWMVRNRQCGGGIWFWEPIPGGSWISSWKNSIITLFGIHVVLQQESSLPKSQKCLHWNKIHLRGKI